MISYEPLFKTLHEKGLYKKVLYEIVHPETVTKMGKSQSVSMSIVMKICLFLNVSIDKVVEIRNEDGSIIGATLPFCLLKKLENQLNNSYQYVCSKQKIPIA